MAGSSNEEHELFLARFHVWRRRVGLIPVIVIDGDESQEGDAEDDPDEQTEDEGEGGAHAASVNSAGAGSTGIGW